ncbi:hypothetical protein [Chryseobacterium sp. OSA05B]|uniref:hypothetical protein n=1 Tax=Chryseobacterium sp. OSA05B TaxID=2862650 RepID=UPI001CBD7E74|nr:hypothetical protein [Chryseobacterium sp. OSA05B]
MGTYELEGLYVYNYAETRFAGTFKLTKEKNGTYTYSMIRTTNKINGSLATARGKDLVIKDNQCIIKINKTCRFKVDFYDGFLRTSAMDENLSSCGFKGTDITLQGTYVRIELE